MDDHPKPKKANNSQYVTKPERGVRPPGLHPPQNRYAVGRVPSRGAVRCPYNTNRCMTMKHLLNGVMALMLMATLLGCRGGGPTKLSDSQVVKPYTLRFCVVSHEPLAGQPAPVEFIFAGRQIKVANAECAARFRTEPAKYLQAIENAEKVFATAKGFEWITVEAYEKLRAGGNAVVLDVRAPAEFNAGHVPGAINLDVNATDFATRAAALDKSKPYLVNCMAGVRGAKACDVLHRLEFPRLYNLEGGLSAWQRAGHQPEQGPTTPNQGIK